MTIICRKTSPKFCAPYIEFGGQLSSTIRAPSTVSVHFLFLPFTKVACAKTQLSNCFSFLHFFSLRILFAGLLFTVVHKLFIFYLYVFVNSFYTFPNCLTLFSFDLHLFIPCSLVMSFFLL